MGLIRVLIFILVIWLAWRMIRNYRVKQERARAEKHRITQKKMVKCEYCKVHLPQQDAISNNDKWFCSREHVQQFIDSE